MPIATAFAAGPRGPSKTTTPKGRVMCGCVKITPNFSFAWTPGRGDTCSGVQVSVCEQRNAAVVVRVLEEGREQEGAKFWRMFSV